MPAAVKSIRRKKVVRPARLIKKAPAIDRKVLKQLMPDKKLLDSLKVKEFLRTNRFFEKDKMRFFSEVQKTIKTLTHLRGKHGIFVNFITLSDIRRAGGTDKVREVLADITDLRLRIRVREPHVEIAERVFTNLASESSSLLDLRDRLNALIKEPKKLTGSVQQARREFERAYV